MRDLSVGTTARGTFTWVAFSHHTWWPGFVMEVDPQGSYSVRYLQEGRIYALSYWATQSGSLLVAGGTVNEAAGASVALIDLDGVPARWTTVKRSRLTCAGCPDGEPAALFVIPPSDVTRALRRPYGWVTRSVVTGSDLLVHIDDGFGSGSLMTLAKDLRVTGFERSDQYWQVHQDLERDGRITHAAAECPELSHPIEIRSWTPAGGWSSVAVPLRLSIATDQATVQ